MNPPSHFTLTLDTEQPSIRSGRREGIYSPVTREVLEMDSRGNPVLRVVQGKARRSAPSPVEASAKVTRTAAPTPLLSDRDRQRIDRALEDELTLEEQLERDRRRPLSERIERAKEAISGKDARVSARAAAVRLAMEDRLPDPGLESRTELTRRALYERDTEARDRARRVRRAMEGRS